MAGFYSAVDTHGVLLRELLALERDARTGRVDHPPHGSKDLADALAGVVYGLTMRCEVWWRHEVNPFEVAPGLVELVKSRDGEANAPSAKPTELAARLSLYG